MTDKKNQPDTAVELRRQAEEKLRQEGPLVPESLLGLSPEEISQKLQELRVYQIEIEMQNEELRRTQEELRDSRARYFDLYDLAPVGYVTLSEKGLILESNLTAATLLCKARNELAKQPVSDFILREDQDIYYRHRKQLFETGEPQTCELRMVRPEEPPFWARLDATADQDKDGSLTYRVVMVDITERKQVEQQQKKINEILEEEVKKRTASLEEMNSALTVLLRRREEDKNQTKENIFTNYKLLVSPFFQKLKSSLTKQQQTLMGMVESNLKECLLPFSQKLSDPIVNFTPAEIQIASFIKHGITTKEIAQALNRSPRTIDAHRDNIRKKLNIKNKNTNLRSFLRNL